ncbi:CYTH and CHAD domain-containing protein [Pseudonocardia sp. TRM90224]|uniref:CYTH and CHAD domain-containing protein n=1 Tax=Pseudonocardia sp. TRM90224 TaxID=2812678 RepID=UPI001E2BF8D0|nr:CYTH and CHAD domain-containing protein [Pseudonocardia sp. TRM90224]
MGNTAATSARSARETERKYEGTGDQPDPATLLDLDPSGGVDEHLDATYFDTDDLRLLRAGITLRRREGGSDPGWHLKLPAGKDTREEIRLPLTDDRVTPPAELAALVRVHTRGAALRPVATLATHRRQWVLTDSAGTAEIAEDSVDAHTMGAETSAMSWREVEVEVLAGGTRKGEQKLLDKLERRLLSGGVRPATSGAKLARVLGDRLPPATTRPAKKGSAGAVVLDYVQEQASELRRYDPLVRRDAPDAVHQMRVAARRLRSALQAYRRVLDRAATEPLVEELRWIGQELAGARDGEVTEERLGAAITALPDELVLGPVAAHMTRTLERRKAEGRVAAIAALDSDRYLALQELIDRLLADPPFTAKATRKARKELPRGVARSWRRTRSRKATADAAPSAAERDLGLHETRKAAKRMRYAVEVARPALGKPAKRLHRRLKAVHSLLGDHQDAVTAQPVIRELAVQAHLDGTNGFTHGLLHANEHTEAEHARLALPKPWKRLDKAATKHL